MTEVTEQFNYWIQTCFMCKQEYKVAKSWFACRRFCSAKCRKDYAQFKSHMSLKEQWHY